MIIILIFQHNLKSSSNQKQYRLDILQVFRFCPREQKFKKNICCVVWWQMHLTMWLWPRPTTLPSDIKIHPAIWLQLVSVTKSLACACVNIPWGHSSPMSGGFSSSQSMTSSSFNTTMWHSRSPLWTQHQRTFYMNYRSSAKLSSKLNFRVCKCCFNLFIEKMPQFSTKFGKRSFSYLASTVWNGLPLNIRLSPAFDTLKCCLKLTFSNSRWTPLPCCLLIDCQRLWFSTITELACVINACIIIITTMLI